MNTGPRRDIIFSFVASTAEVDELGYSPPTPTPAGGKSARNENAQIRLRMGAYR